MVQATKPWLVDTDWLETHLDAPDLIVLDASWHLPSAGRDAKNDYLAAHIPGAVLFDIDDLSDETSSLPHMLPSTTKFSSRMKAIGLGDGMRVVVYDTSGIFAAARAWWMLRIMGHEDVAVLNGGFKKWTAEGRATEDGAPPARVPKHFTPRFNSALLAELEEMRAFANSEVDQRRIQVVDARPAGRFAGIDAEPRPGLRRGHIPGSSNVPHNAVLNADGTMKSDRDITALFEAAGVRTNDPLVASCGSGVSAAVLALALATTGRNDVAIYDGSWAEWGADDSLPIATG